MRKILAMVVLAGVLATTGVGVAAAAMGGADNMQKKGSWYIGFWDLNAPVAVRTLLTDDWELMAGGGLHHAKGGDTEVDVSGAVAYRLVHGSRGHLSLRPRFFYAHNPGTGLKSLFAVGADLAVEVNISSAVSIVAGQGVEYLSESPVGGGDKFTVFQSRAVDAGQVGFWVRLPQ